MTIPAIPTNLTERLNALEARSRVEEEQASVTPLPRFRGARDNTVFVQQLTCALRERRLILLEKCLTVTAEPTVDRATRALQHVDAGSLLVYLVHKINYAGSVPPRIHTWIKCTLLHHATYLAQAPGIQNSLKVLGTVLHEAQALRKPLAGLVGRADLVSAHAARQHQASDAVLKGLAEIAGAPGVMALQDLTVGEELGSGEETDGSEDDGDGGDDSNVMTDDSSEDEE